MIKKINIFTVFFLFLLSFKFCLAGSIFIAYKINEEIITNIDIENEASYLKALNLQLKNLSNEKILEIAEQSLIRETIKKNELSKFIDVNKISPFVETVIKDFYRKLNLNNKEEFKKYLNDNNLKVFTVEKKINIEASWNRFIYEKYQNQVRIDVPNLKKRIVEKKLAKTNKLFFLTEILFEKNENFSIEETHKKILESINDIGFKNTANIYSISDSAKFGGDIGWIEEKNISNNISNLLNQLNIGEYSKPISTGNNFLILKIEDIKMEKVSIDEEKELEKMIQIEQNRALDKFSKIYFNKIKMNTIISEL